MKRLLVFSIFISSFVFAEIPNNFWQLALQPFTLKNDQGDGNNGPNASVIISKSFLDSKLSLDLIPLMVRNSSGIGQAGFVGGVSFQHLSNNMVLKAGYFIGGFDGNTLMGPGVSVDLVSADNYFAGMQCLLLSEQQAAAGSNTTAFHASGIRLGKIF